MYTYECTCICLYVYGFGNVGCGDADLVVDFYGRHNLLQLLSSNCHACISAQAKCVRLGVCALIYMKH